MNKRTFILLLFIIIILIIPEVALAAEPEDIPDLGDRPSATASNNGPVCVGATLQLIGDAKLLNEEFQVFDYYWTGPNGFTSSSRMPVISYHATLSMAGDYVFTVTDQKGRTAQATTHVNVLADCVIIDKSANMSKQPKSLTAAVAEIKSMLDAGKSRWEIAQRVATIADIQQKNLNDFSEISYWWETLSFLAQMVKVGVPLDRNSAFVDPQRRQFDSWREDRAGAIANYKMTATWLWTVKAGQCAENSALVYYLLKEAGVEDVRIFTAQAKDHQFVVWGLGCNDPDKRETWTNDVIIPDGWLHMVMRGSIAAGCEYTAGAAAGKKPIIDQTKERDPWACGYPGIHPVGKDPKAGTDCCKTIPPCCRGVNPGACGDDGKCYLCGKKDELCCKPTNQGETECIEGLVCVDNKCVERRADLGDTATGKFKVDSEQQWEYGVPIVNNSIVFTFTAGESGPVKGEGRFQVSGKPEGTFMYGDHCNRTFHYSMDDVKYDADTGSISGKGTASDAGSGCWFGKGQQSSSEYPVFWSATLNKETGQITGVIEFWSFKAQMEDK